MVTKYIIKLVLAAPIGGVLIDVNVIHLGNTMINSLFKTNKYLIYKTKNFLKTSILILIILSSSSCVFAGNFQEDDHLIMEKFFRTIFTNSEGGYVALGKKPICIIGYYNIDD